MARNEYKKVELTSDDVIEGAAKSLADYIAEAREIALKEEIKANTVILDKTFAKVNGIHLLMGRDVLHIPPMICGLEVRITDELPDGYSFALVEALETERERIIKKAKSEVAREIFDSIYDKLNFYIKHRDVNATIAEMLEKIETVDKKYTEENQ